MTIVSRDSLNEINGIVINGQWHSAGQVKDFRSNNTMRQYLPENLSLSWVSLDAAEPLEGHFHPIDSYVMLLENDACYIADEVVYLKAGEVVRIPSYKLHSFAQGTSQKKFWGLAWNMTTSHLFAESNGERLVFFKDELETVQTKSSSYENILGLNHDRNFFSQSGLAISAECVNAGSSLNFQSDKNTWLIFPVDGCIEQSLNIIFKSGDAVLLEGKSVCIKNTSNSNINVFKLSKF